MATREDNLFMAAISYKAGMQDDCLQFIRELADQADQLTDEERDLISKAYCKIISAIKDSSEIVSKINRHELTREQVSLLERYESVIEDDMSRIGAEIIGVIKRVIKDTTAENPIAYRPIDMENLSLEETVFMASLALKAKRYREGINFMLLVSIKKTLTDHERNMLFGGYNSMIGDMAASLHVCASEIEQDHLDMIQSYTSKIRSQIHDIVDEALQVLDNNLLSKVDSSLDPDALKMFYIRMTIQYLKLKVEYLKVVNSSDREKIITAFIAAQNIANQELAPTHVLRLRLFLEFSVFYYDTCSYSDLAYNMARQAIDESVVELESSAVVVLHKKSKLIIETLCEKLSQWTSDSITQVVKIPFEAYIGSYHFKKMMVENDDDEIKASKLRILSLKHLLIKEKVEVLKVKVLLGAEWKRVNIWLDKRGMPKATLMVLNRAAAQVRMKFSNEICVC